MSIVFGTVVLVVSFTASPAHGQAPDQTGWWFELKSKTLPVAVIMPTVPDGGLYVQQGPDGNPMAFGAVRYRVPSAASATLTLAAAQGSTTTLGAPLQACATTSTWIPPLPAPGYWEEAPTYGKTCSPGAVSSDGKYVAFLFGPEFLATGALDVAIVPKDGASPFAIAFDKPAGDSLVVKSAPYGTPTTTPPPTFAAPAGGGGPGPIALPPVTVALAVTPTTVPSVVQPMTVAQQVFDAAGLGDPDRGERMAALFGSSAILVGWWLLSSRRARTPQLVGALVGGGAVVDSAAEATGRVGGVGRFARTRERNARALR